MIAADVPDACGMVKTPPPARDSADRIANGAFKGPDRCHAGEAVRFTSGGVSTNENSRGRDRPGWQSRGLSL